MATDVETETIVVPRELAEALVKNGPCAAAKRIIIGDIDPPKHWGEDILYVCNYCGLAVVLREDEKQNN